MKRKTKQKWHLDPKEVTGGIHGSSSGKTGIFERKLKITGSTVFLTHMPTGIEVEAEVPPGHYSKKEMQQKREALKESLFRELEDRVAKVLKVKGR